MSSFKYIEIADMDLASAPHTESLRPLLPPPTSDENATGTSSFGGKDDKKQHPIDQYELVPHPTAPSLHDSDDDSSTTSDGSGSSGIVFINGRRTSIHDRSLSSCILFFLGCFFYFVLAVRDLYWEVRDLEDDDDDDKYDDDGDDDDDDDDDTVFEIKKFDITISMIIYLLAALFFLLNGLFDYMEVRSLERHIWLPTELSTKGIALEKRVALMLASGATFDLFAAFSSESDPEAMSTAFNSVASHLYLLEALFAVVGRYLLYYGVRGDDASDDDRRRCCVYVRTLDGMGDVLFLGGSFIDVAVGYCYIIPWMADSLTLMVWELLSSTFWLVDAILYLVLFYEQHKRTNHRVEQHDMI